MPRFLFITAGFLVFVFLPSLSWSMDIPVAVMGTEVEDRSISGEGTSFSVSAETIYCFTQIQGGSGKAVHHVWLREGVEVLNITLAVGADTWRTWSGKALAPGMEGAWQVRVLDDAGALLKEISFTVTP